MSKWEITDELRNRQEVLLESDFDAYCIQTHTKDEIPLCNHINTLNPNCLALPLLKSTHKSVNGVKSVILKSVLPSYCFLYTPKGWDTNILERTFKESFHFINNVDKDSFILKGSDLSYAKMVFSYGGIIGMSKALNVDGKIIVVDGPLENLKGNIKEYSKKNRNCRIEIPLFGQTVSAWLPFEWISADES